MVWIVEEQEDEIAQTKYLTCKCGNDERKYGGRVSPDGVFTCEICCKGKHHIKEE